MGPVLVLGAGWVGSAVARHAARSHEVINIDPPFVPELAARDLAATRELTRIVRSSDVTMVINACGRIRGSAEDLVDANVEFPRWLCEALSDTGARLVHLGSAAEYGDPGPDPVLESTPDAPSGDYATTKARGTEVVTSAHADGLDAVVVRVFNTVGYPVPQVSPVHQWLTDLQSLPDAGGTVEVWWPPTTRDFVAIDEVAAAVVDLAAPGDRPAIVNVCSGVGLSYGDIVATLATHLGIPAEIRSLERPGIETVIGDPTLLHSTIGWTPSMSLVKLAGTVAPGGATDIAP